jgi:hypothetical protein
MRRTPRQLFLISFAILFLEMAAIRWLNASVTVLAYFNNLILISCFFGLGLGCLLATRRVDLIRLVAPGLLLLVLCVVLLHRYGIDISYTEDVIISASAEYWETGVLRFSLAALTAFFVNVAFFVLLGQELGKQLSAVPHPLVAYGYDIAGSLGGVLAYGLVAWMGTPPHVWYIVGVLVLLWFLRDQRAWLAWSIGISVVAILFVRMTYPDATWSPYYKVEVAEYLGAEEDVLGYQINVDNRRIQDALDFGPELEASRFRPWIDYYELPYHLIRPRKVLILGAGAGNEAAVALMHGVEHIDAVEIDPVIASFGHELHPNQPYADEQVSIHVDDARSFVSNTEERYDLIVMSALDSHKQIAGMASLRLESFVYTVESYRKIRTLLAPDGVFVLNLGSGRPWMGERTYWSLTEAFGEEPRVLTSTDSPFASVAYTYAPEAYFERTLLPEAKPIRELSSYERPDDLLLATDNWPHLYLESNTIPNLYLAVLGIMTLLSVLLVLGFEPSVRRPNLHFFFLGAGFMLLETRSVTQMALLFGATWNVNTIVFASILLTIFIANYLVLKKKRPSRRLAYGLLFVTLVAGFFFPFDILLPLPAALRVLAAGVVIGLPIIWASFIFSISFKAETAISTVFGSNLLGIVFGGALEYLSNVAGLNVLYLVALGLYVASAVFVRQARVPLTV